MKILAVHPNFELYGSDRWFANALVAMENEFGADRIRVLLPRSGPIETLEPFGRVQIDYLPMFILRRKRFWLRIFKALGGLPRGLYRALSAMNNSEATYINTIIPIEFLIMARFSKRPVVLHIHEIPLGNELAVFRFLILFSKAKLIFNSVATLRAFKLPENTQTSIVYNGYPDPGPVAKSKDIGVTKLHILMIGRINHWKGQEILIEACSLLPSEIRSVIDVRIVGSAFEGSEHLLISLRKLIRDRGLENTISLAEFEDDPSKSYKAADIVIVPSRLPEPFGRVAIEAMAHGCAVIASNHGGLVEILIDGETGKLVEPGSPTALASAIYSLVINSSEIERMGLNGRSRFQQIFTQEAVDISFVSSMAEIVNR